MADAPRPEQGTGWYRGAVYSRTWLTTLIGIPLLGAIGLTVVAGTGEWVVLVPLTLLVGGALWLTPLSVITPEGIRLVLQGTFVPWAAVEWVLDPRPGDEEARVELTGGSILVLPGVPPGAVPTLRSLLARGRPDDGGDRR
jgi:hypothetical protein